jgi:predicted PurR-regulated permease PerM
VPDWAAVSLVFVGVVALFAGLTMGLGASVADFNASIDDFGGKARDRFRQPIEIVTEFLAARDYDVSLASLESHFDPQVILKYFGNVAGVAADTLSNTFFILLTVVFILGEAAGFPRKLQEAFRGRTDIVIEGEAAQAVAAVRDYLRIKTEVSIATGALAALLTAVVGVDYAILWGVVAFGLNFVPNIGSMIAAVPPVLYAVVQLGWDEALWVLIGYTLINTVIGNLVEPKLMGRKLGLSSLVVWLSLVFWGWVWGPVGMLLSVPLTMLAKILLEKWDDLRWIAVLLGPGGEEFGRPPREGETITALSVTSEIRPEDLPDDVREALDAARAESDSAD